MIIKILNVLIIRYFVSKESDAEKPRFLTLKKPLIHACLSLSFLILPESSNLYSLLYKISFFLIFLKVL